MQNYLNETEKQGDNIMKLFKSLPWTIEYKINNIREQYDNYKLKQKYPDYDEQYDCGTYHFVYGVKSWDDLTGRDCNVWTMNDFEIGYDRESKNYSLSVETAWMWHEDRYMNECKYLIRMLDVFTKYMNDNNLSKNEMPCLFMTQPGIEMKAKTIEELYMKFRMYVYGYCKVCGYEEG